ncbi:MAG: DUF502 domain-containing protein [Planctomycetota bacterium]
MTDSSTGKPAASSGPGIVKILRNRILQGLFVVLPLYITWIVIKWLYDTVSGALISPIAQFLLDTWYPDGADPEQAPVWIINVAATLAAIGLVLGVVFLGGMFFRSRTHRLVDWILRSVPGVSTIYSAVSNVISAISTSQDAQKFQRVVLVQFPHPGMKVPAFVTSECQDLNTDRTILCVYVPTTPIPTSGYMLLVPEEEVVAVNWDLEETLQAIVSGGITVPPKVIYDQPVEIERLKESEPRLPESGDANEGPATGEGSSS